MLKTLTVSAITRYCDNAQKIAAYKAGLQKIKDIGFWDYEQPDISPAAFDFNAEETAELLLSSARLYGFLALTRKNGQETSKNFLTRANDLFVQLGHIEKQVLCSNYLALSEWRVGALGEAEIWLQNARSLHLPALNPARLHTFIVESLVNCTNGKYREILARLNAQSNNFLRSGDDYLLGLFYMNRGIGKKNLGDMQGALYDQTRAGDIFAQSGHLQFASYAENNLACLYRAKGETSKAFIHTNNALSIAKQVGDVRQIGCCYDTLALLALDAGDYQTAIDYSDRAIANLEQTECYAYLVEYLETKIKILLKLNDKQAYVLYARAMSLAERFCPSVCERLTDTIRDKKETRPEGVLTFTFVEGFEPTGKILCANIAVDDFIYLGITRGCKVVIEDTTVVNGDFAAIVYDEEWYLGVYTCFYEMVALQVDESEPQMFNEKDIKILGKVIGYCNGEKDSDNNLIVIPL